MTSRPKVFCIGFQKTGTTSLYAALTMLGYRTAAVVGRGWSAARLRQEGAKLCIDVARRFDAAEDMPWPIFFRELDAAFPGAKFILTLRDGLDWFSSIESHFGTRPNAMQAFVYGDDAAAPAGNRERYLSVYEAHNAAVLRHFAGRPNDLLVMDVTKGDGWDKLAPFLDLAAPGRPFPAKNRRTDRRRLSYRMMKKALALIGLAPGPERLA
jgi:hypothetical protein